MIAQGSEAQVRAEFGLEDVSADDLRGQLRRMLAAAHPDRTGGEFGSEDQRSTYLRLQQALESLDGPSDPTEALVPVSVVTDLVEVVRGLAPSQKADSAEARLATTVGAEMANLRSQYRAPRITAAAIASAMTALWLFPTQVMEHPILGQFVRPASNLFGIVYLEVLLLAGAAWFITASSEARRRQFLGIVKTEAWQNTQLCDYLRDENALDKDRFVAYLMRGGRPDDATFSVWESLPVRLPRNLLGLGRVECLDAELAQSIADTVVARAETRGIIQRDAGSTAFSDRYVLAQGREVQQRHQPDGQAVE